MIKVKLTAEAEIELENIIKYIAEDNPKRARTYTKEMLKKAFDLLEVFPLSCPIYNKEKNIRIFIFEEYNLFYRFDEVSKTAYIVHILSSSKRTEGIL